MMHRLFFTGLILLGLAYYTFGYKPVDSPESALYQPRPAYVVPTLPPIEVQADSIKPDIPMRITIPSINLNAAIIPMGLTEELIVDTPEFDVGWYKDGVKPGEIGTAALNGHVQNVPAKPGVFSRLSQVKIGEEIVITDKQNQQYRYQVTQTELVTVAAFPLERVYGHTDKARLSIVTCAGTYNPTKEDFPKRTIVYAELIN